VPRRPTISDVIADELKLRILAGEWTLGQALPSNKQLAEEFDTSTLTVREAVAQLIAAGFLESRHGSGTYVVDVDPAAASSTWLLSRGDAGEVEELIEARRIIESSILELATQRRTDKQLAELRRCAETMAAARENAEGFIAADFEFHQLVAEAAHNRILLRAMLAMRGPLRRLMSERAVEDLHDHGNLDTPIADHFAVVDALERRDVDVAVGALSNMIRRNQDHLRRTRADAVRPP
jgi:GntR family transcriptional repressor for pyruvate dehydrogenase complex